MRWHRHMAETYSIVSMLSHKGCRDWARTNCDTHVEFLPNAGSPLSLDCCRIAESVIQSVSRLKHRRQVALQARDVGNLLRVAIRSRRELALSIV